MNIDQNIENNVSNEVNTSMDNPFDAINDNGSPNVLLVVDDNKINLKVASRILEGLSYDVDTANSGYECIEKISQDRKKYDLIFMDIMMPNMDGVETMKKLKSMDDFRTPIIALTADAVDGSREKYLAYGFDEYVAKPIIKQILEKTLDKVINLDDIKMVDRHETTIEDSSASALSANNPTNTTPVAETSTQDSEQDDKSYALLVVDDNKVNLKVASRMLENLSYHVDTANSGYECLDMISKDKNKYNLIFMDIMMPNMDGVETMKKLKSMEDFHTPVIALTADSVDGSREKYLASGFDEYVSKPIIKDILEKTLDKCINLDDIKMVDHEDSDEDIEVI